MSRRVHPFTATLLVLLAGLLVSACQQDQSPASPEAESSAGPDPRMVDIVRPSQTTRKPASLDINLRPEVITAATGKIRVALQGCREERNFRWAVNGLPVDRTAGPTLVNVDLARGDSVEVTAWCGERTASATREVGNAPPRVTAVGLEDHQLRAGQEIVLLPEAHDADGDLVDFRVDWRVDGEDLTWIDGLALPGDRVSTGSTIELTIIPNDGIEDGPEFVAEPLTVPEQPPEFVSAVPETFEMQPFRYRAEAVDPDGDAISYHLEEAPDGMTLDADSGELTWTIPPGTRGEFPVRIVAEDATGQQAVQTFTLKF